MSTVIENICFYVRKKTMGHGEDLGGTGLARLPLSVTLVHSTPQLPVPTSPCLAQALHLNSSGQLEDVKGSS